jgi:hypothetical protein
MHLVAQCSNCGMNVRPELGVATATTFQHRKCADRFGIGTHGQSIVLPIDDAVSDVCRTGPTSSFALEHSGR